jgi:hypothetical protein
MRWPRSASRWAIACSALLAIGCAGALSDPQRFAYLDGGGGDGGPLSQGDGGCDPAPTVFIPSCATGACHSAQAQQGNLDLQSTGMPARLVGKRASGGPGYIIDHQQPLQSVILTKVSANPPFNFQMPLGAPPLAADEVACIQMWVTAATQ